MNDVLFKARCNKGFITIYQDRVTVGIETNNVDKIETLDRNKITGVAVDTYFASFMGYGGMAKVTFHSTGNQEISVKTVKLKDARKIKELITLTNKK